MKGKEIIKKFNELRGQECDARDMLCTLIRENKPYDIELMTLAGILNEKQKLEEVNLESVNTKDLTRVF